MPHRVPTNVPLFVHTRPDTPIAFSRGVTIDAHRYLADVRALADRLPDTPDVLNACGDRYSFAVGLGAALVRGQRTLLPAKHAPATLDRIAREHPGLHALTDRPGPEMALPCLGVDCDGDPKATPFDVPAIPREALLALAARLRTHRAPS